MSPMVFTKKQVEILRFVYRGLSQSEIGQALGLDESEVQQHLARICRRLGVRSSQDAVRVAIAQGWLYKEKCRRCLSVAQVCQFYSPEGRVLYLCVPCACETLQSVFDALADLTDRVCEKQPLGTAIK